MAAGVTLLHKRKAGAFTNGQLAAGEIGLDTTNSVIYYSINGSTVVSLAATYQPLSGQLTEYVTNSAGPSNGSFWVKIAGAWVGRDSANARADLGLSTADSPEFTAINLGHASNTTITRVSAGVIAVEGATVYTQGGALGTPASGTLTNCTGLPLTTGVTGNLPVTNLNSGTSASSSTFWRGDGTWAAATATTASTTEVLTGTDSSKAVTPDALAAIWEKGADIASSGTISIGEGGFFHITGTSTITDIDFATDKTGRSVWLTFDGALTLTHHATTLILPTGANITTAAGDVGLFTSEGSDAIRCLVYMRKNGKAVGLDNVDNTSDATKNAATATLTNKIINHNTALGSDDTYEGTVLSGRNAGATIAQWEAVYLGGSSTWLLADANGSSTYPARGLAVAAYSNTNPALILVQGVVRNDAWNWTVNGDIYLSGTAGALTQTAPSTSGDKIQVVGWAITADIAYFHFNQTYLTKT